MTAGVKGSKATTTYGGGSRYSPIRTAPNEIRDTGGASEVVVAVVSQEEYLILQPEEQQHEPSSNNGLISVNDSSFSPLGGHGNHHDVSSTDNNNNNEEEDEEVVYISVNDAIERLGFGRFQYQITIAAGLCFESDAMQIMLLSFVTLTVQYQWHLTDTLTANRASPAVCLSARWWAR